MFVHLAVPVASSSAAPSRPTSTFCASYVAQYIMQTISVALTHLLHREKLERCRYLFIWNTLYSAPIGREMREIPGGGSHNVYIMDMPHMHSLRAVPAQAENNSHHTLAKT